MEEKKLYCRKCGNVLENGENFCRNCGQKVENNVVNTLKKAEEENEEVQEVHENNNSIEKTLPIQVQNHSEKSNQTSPQNNIPKAQQSVKKTSTSGKIFIGILLTIIIIGGLLYGGLLIVRQEVYTPQKSITEFQRGLINGDNDKLNKILVCTDERLQLTPENIKVLEDYFKTNPSKLNDICNDLINSIKTKTYSQKIFSLEKSDGLMGFLGEYKICIKPIFLEVSSQLDNVTFSVNNNEQGNLAIGSNKEIGPLMPGMCNIKAKYSNNYITLDYDIQLDSILKNENNKIIANIFEDYKTVKINTIYTDAYVIANGVNLGKTVQELGYMLTPVDNNTKIKLQLNVDNNSFTTDEITVANDSIITFGNIPALDKYYTNKMSIENFTTDLSNNVNNLIQSYEYGFSAAINHRDFTFLIPTLYPNSSLYNAQQDYINTCVRNKVYEYFISAATKNVKYDPVTKTGSVDVDEIFNTITNGVSKEGSYFYTYTFAYNETSRTFQLTDMIAR